jgi:mRNA interferase YafQ
MKFAPTPNGAFKRDVKRIQRRRYPIVKLQQVIALLCKGDDLPPRCRVHKLVGNYAGCWECHIEPDWLLIYQYEDALLKLIRTGTHADLFD